MTDELTIPISVGGGAMMFIENTKADPPIEWLLRYSRDLNHPLSGRFSAAAVVESYTYLLSRNITTAEAIRRLRMLRIAAHAHGIAAATTKQEEGETLPGILCPNGGYCDYPSNPCFTCRRPRPSNPSGDGSQPE